MLHLCYVIVDDPIKVWTIIKWPGPISYQIKKNYIIDWILQEVNQWLLCISGTNDKANKQRCQVLYDLKCESSFK